jgi:hypothetical protein
MSNSGRMRDHQTTLQLYRIEEVLVGIILKSNQIEAMLVEIVTEKRRETIRGYQSGWSSEHQGYTEGWTEEQHAALKRDRAALIERLRTLPDGTVIEI